MNNKFIQIEKSVKNKYFRLICALIGLSFSCQIYSQTPQPYPLSVPSDFSVKTIYELHEDFVTKDIWIGTEEGLFKYDGVSFQHYFPPNFSPDLSGIKQDSTGRIWCQNFSGQIFYIENDELKLFVNLSKYETNFPNYFLKHFPTIYVTSSYGYMEIDFHTKKEKIHHLKIDSSNYKINTANDTLFFEKIINLKSNQGKFILQKDKMLCTIDLDKNKDSIYCTPIPSDTKRGINFIFKSDTILIFSNSFNSDQVVISELTRHHTIQQKSLPNFITNIIPSSIYQDNALFWLGLEDGLVVLNEKYQSVYGNQRLLEEKIVSDIIKDSEGNYWIATLNDGVYLLPSKDILVWNKDNSSIQSNEITAITKDKDKNLFILERNGLAWRLNQKTQKITYLCDFKTTGKWLFYDAYNNRLYCQYSNYFYDLTTEKMTYLHSGQLYKNLAFLDQENMLYSFYQGAHIINRQNSQKNVLNESWYKNFSYIRHKKDKKLILRQKRTAFNCYDSINRTIWIGYTDGLYQYKNGIGKEIKYNKKPIIVTSLIAAQKGGVWLSTLDNKLLHLQNTEVVSEINLTINQTVLELKESKNYLFLATNKGVFRYDLSKKTTELFNQLDGLPSNNISGLEIIDSLLYISTNNGMTSIPITYSSINQTIPSIAISKVAIWEQDTILLPIYYLSASNNNISIAFKGRSIRSQGSLRYKYRMLGLNETWVEVPSYNNIARFPSLPSGTYTFEVKTINEDGVESTVPASIQFFIDKPYYLKWWFIFLIICVIAALISSFFLFRINTITKQNELLANQQSLETQLISSQLTALRSQMNPHFMFNALNSIQEYTMTNQKVLAVDYLGKFSDLIRLYLNHSRVQTITLQEEVEALSLYLDLEKMRFEDSLDYTLELDKNIITEDFRIPPMLIQPYVENAIKHGLFHKKTNRQLYVDFSKNNKNALVCIIRDNGIGRQQAININKIRKNKPTSFATSAIENRLSLLNQSRVNKIETMTTDLFDELQRPCGTEVKITIP